MHLVWIIVLDLHPSGAVA